MLQLKMADDLEVTSSCANPPPRCDTLWETQHDAANGVCVCVRARACTHAQGLEVISGSSTILDGRVLALVVPDQP